jgi:hypothetical protein
MKPLLLIYTQVNTDDAGAAARVKPLPGQSGMGIEFHIVLK